ncbi:Cof-type HAD-IIB family hydrolase [Thorsellia anophelis]|uniref:Cof subfamily of IIB subfamily of haloacid dehalogenase superfamily/HAD-superfamily hydrolase, subfamily IIB n=1 Tax=Thorsellia anophelis DSM 18579 TaxID=1123402 RepID=A0A1I0AC56_9GAMM|nr:HAD family hydrolase [Thorsellia anophelis]SES91629.1 hypothetical protein SAMN02583745_00880 [Thorsellia anophelis DSM 18579]
MTHIVKHTVFCDVDGTFCHYNEPVSQLNLDAVKAFQIKGNRFVFVSGRSASQLAELNQTNGLECDLIFANGAGYQHYGQQPIYEHILTLNELELIIPLIEELDLFYHCHTSEEIYLRPIVNYQTHFERLKPVFYELGDFGRKAIAFKETYFTHECQHIESPLSFFQNNPSIKVVKIEIMEPDTHRLVALNNLLDSLGLSYYSSFPTNLEIVNPKASKGIAIESYLKQFPTEISYGIGDAANDIDMLKVVDVPVAVANASDEIKALCQYVTLDVANSGVGVFINKHILKE